MLYKEELHNALYSKSPVESIRELILKLNRQGVGKQQIYNFVNDYYKELLDQEGKELEENILFDILDIISGWYNSKNLNLKD
jgi:hypothetical protein